MTEQPAGPRSAVEDAGRPFRAGAIGGAEAPRWQRALLGAPGLWLSALWGFLEGTLFFVVPDVLFSLTTVFSRGRGLLQLGAAVGGAVVAGGVMYSWAAADPHAARAAVVAVPFVGEKIVAPVEHRWDDEGATMLFENPLSGVPYKVYAVTAPPRMSLGTFLLASVPARAERMTLSWVVFALVAWWRTARDEHKRRVAAIRFHIVSWTLLYAVYWTVNV